MTPAPLYRDGYVLAALLLGLLGLAFPVQDTPPPLWKIALLAAAEESVFRCGLQDWLEQRLLRSHPIGVGPISPANIAASLLFSLAHLPFAPFLHAFSVFFPSLVFGVLWSRHRSLALCAGMHWYYNTVYSYLSMP